MPRSMFILRLSVFVSVKSPCAPLRPFPPTIRRADSRQRDVIRGILRIRCFLGLAHHRQHLGRAAQHSHLRLRAEPGQGLVQRFLGRGGKV